MLHSVTRSAELGWEEFHNGNLLSIAENAGFEVMVTADKNIRYQQNLTRRKISIVVLPSGQWPEVREQLQEVVNAIDDAVPGSYCEIARIRNSLPLG